MDFKNAVRLVVPLTIALFLAACASTEGITLAEKQAATEGYRLPSGPSPGEAIVYIVRPDTVGFAIRFKVYLDGQREEGTYVGYTRGVQYLAFPVSEGNHTVHSKAENWSSVQFYANPGDIIFLRQTPQMGFFISANVLERIADIDGKYLMVEYGLERGTYVSGDLVPYGPPEELAPAKTAEDASTAAADGSAQSDSSEESEQPETASIGNDSGEHADLLGRWAGEIFNNPTYPYSMEISINSIEADLGIGSVTKHSSSSSNCVGTDVTLGPLGDDQMTLRFNGGRCNGSGNVKLIGDNELKGLVRIGGRNWNLEFDKEN